jgi:lipoprotein-anchoring transpeptidase ErfK/SrfK
MTRRIPVAIALSLGVLGAVAAPAISASATSGTRSYAISSDVATSLTVRMPIVRLHFSATTKVKNLPLLTMRPALATSWQQISAHDVQAVITGSIKPATNYTILLPTRMTCSPTCSFTSVRPHVATVATSTTWEEQLLAELNYLPVSFAATTPQSDPSQPANGTFTWKYTALPEALRSQWIVGANGAILRGALMNFQSVNDLPTTGVADSTTWSALINAVLANKVDPTTYNYVSVSEGSPETLTLYVKDHVQFRTLVNTGISEAPTETGTYPVYVRYLSTTMSGTNPDGSHYSDPGIQWVSYFNGGDALHEFPRYSYGFAQSLGCVEMPFASAQTVFPFTPIGTLVTVNL